MNAKIADRPEVRQKLEDPTRPEPMLAVLERHLTPS
jgi:hypothetical protein